VGVSGTRGRKRFQAAAGATLAKELRLDEDWRTVSAAWIRHAFGDEPSGPVRALDARDEVIRRLLFGWTEINRSLETLGDVAVYLSRFPPARMVPRQRYLRFLVEAHYHELYVLSERLRTYSTTVEREYKRDSRFPAVRRASAAARELAAQVLSGVVHIRGAHVHVSRLAHAGIERLDSLWLLLDVAPTPIPRHIVRYREREYQRVRAEIRTTVARLNRAVGTLVDLFCDALFPAIFSDSLELIYPEHIRPVPRRASQS
jgi:hypothetical protein